jgi:hypothetical protein
MLQFLLHSRTALGCYFPDTYSKEFNERQTPSASSDGCVSVLNCLFNYIKSTSNGGALYCTSNYLLAVSSSFFSCNASAEYGGAIYFNNAVSGECILHGLCGNGCCTTHTSSAWGQFAWITVKNDASSKNYINYSSISRCGDSNSDARQTLRHENGKDFCQSVNISMSKCVYRSGIICTPNKDSISVTCSLSYSTFADNNASIYNCISCYSEVVKFEINFCNILRNKQVTLYQEGTIFTIGNLMIKNSCILENEATYIFYRYSSSYSITLSNCTVDKTTCNQNLIIQSTVSKSFILALDHMSTQNCHSEYDSVGSLTVIPCVSRPTKRVFCHTCENYHYQSIVSDFFTLICLFLVTFIHSNPLR